MGRKILVDADDLDLITSRHRYFRHADGEPCHCDNCQTERRTLRLCPRCHGWGVIGVVKKENGDG